MRSTKMETSPSPSRRSNPEVRRLNNLIKFDYEEKCHHHEAHTFINQKRQVPECFTSHPSLSPGPVDVW